MIGFRSDSPLDKEHAMLILEEDRPSPFTKPLLELGLAGGEAENLGSDHKRLYIDVDGKIDLYIAEDKSATEILIDLCKSFAKAGVIVTDFNTYIGSGAPNVIMRNGALFMRMKSVESPSEEVFAYEYRPPKYRGR